MANLRVFGVDLYECVTQTVPSNLVVVPVVWWCVNAPHNLSAIGGTKLKSDPFPICGPCVCVCRSTDVIKHKSSAIIRYINTSCRGFRREGFCGGTTYYWLVGFRELRVTGL